jgi:hypothetical protein
MKPACLQFHTLAVAVRRGDATPLQATLVREHATRCADCAELYRVIDLGLRAAAPAAPLAVVDEGDGSGHSDDDDELAHRLAQAAQVPEPIFVPTSSVSAPAPDAAGPDMRASSTTNEPRTRWRRVAVSAGVVALVAASVLVHVVPRRTSTAHASIAAPAAGSEAAAVGNTTTSTTRAVPAPAAAGASTATTLTTTSSTMAFSRLEPSPHLRLLTSAGWHGGFARIEATDVHLRVDDGTVAIALVGGDGRRVTIETFYGDVVLAAGRVVVQTGPAGLSVVADDAAADLVRDGQRTRLGAGVVTRLGPAPSAAPDAALLADSFLSAMPAAKPVIPPTSALAPTTTPLATPTTTTTPTTAAAASVTASQTTNAAPAATSTSTRSATTTTATTPAARTLAATTGPTVPTATAPTTTTSAGLVDGLAAAERAARSGDIAAADALYASLRRTSADVASVAIIDFEQARLHARRGEPAAQATLRRLASTGGPIAAEAALAVCEVDLARAPCVARACLQTLAQAEGRARAGAQRLLARGHLDERCRPTP